MTYVLYSLQFAMMLLRGLTKRKFATMDQQDRDNARQILDSLVMAANQALTDLEAAPAPPKKVVAKSSASKSMTKSIGSSAPQRPDRMDFANLDHWLLWHIVGQEEVNLYFAERADAQNAESIALLKQIKAQGEQRTADTELAAAARSAICVLDELTAQLSLATPDA